MEVRAINPTELDQLLELYTHLHRVDDVRPDQAVVAATWRELMSSPRYGYIGAFVGGSLVSSCTITVVPNLTRRARPYGVVENVVTHRDHRKRGYGKAVLTHALARAWSFDCYKVMLLTGRKDSDTLRFYRSVGFDGDDKLAFVAKPAT